MILAWLLIVLLAGAALSWLVSRWSSQASRWIALAALAVDFALVVFLWARHPISPSLDPTVLAEINWRWIPQIGASFHLAADGLSLILVTLTLFLGGAAVAASWTEIRHRVGFFHFNLLLTLAGIIGVFTALDLFLFYFFWELMLVPMYFLIILWGHENRVRAGLKFFIFTQASGLLMLVSILALYFLYAEGGGVYSFDYRELLQVAVERKPHAVWLMLGFFAAFAVKLPVVPLHVWLPDAHTEAPTAGSVILSGLMLKTGAYGFLRFLVPFFPGIAAEFMTAAFVLAVVGILYGAALAFAQTDLKRYVAFSSVSHMGFILLGIAAWNELALQGVVIVILAHGLSTSALFILVGALQERIHTRDLGVMGGLWDVLPKMGGAGTFFALASLGLPGLANFVGEFLVLLGTYQVNPTLAILSALGLVFSAVYSLWLVQRAFHGSVIRQWDLPRTSIREMTVFGLFMAGLIWIGLFPQPVFRAAGPALEALRAGTAKKSQRDSHRDSAAAVPDPVAEDRLPPAKAFQ
ncbi:MAG: NADH-quinone oxidoreductase subunit M [Candidatus Abyssobacteria bacterium SURF_5]|uniref:NADH-quinone oxidoreductase subunit M n=1 Tax=Abyssobacteria bacterium (strain SURF_5) TaxID=2093360 RepID=A0A3A4NNT7_ABYX5|nr:MAG: NADH-quinone oxidoreductase subunit M [Candidatus Abyssubacteria bacterium SURF_5]